MTAAPFARLGQRLLAIVMAAGLLAGASSALASKKDNTVRFAYDQAPESVDPYFNNVRIGVIIGANVWDTLVYRDATTNEYSGNLAKSWKQIDERTLEFELREGIKFHNGEPFDADSVVYTLNFVADPANAVTTQANVNWIEKATKVSPYVVRVTTKKVFPAAIEYLAGPVVIHPAKYYAEVGPKGMNAKPVGTGPFKVTQYAPGKSITLERNPDYFKESAKGTPKIDKLEVRFIRTARPRWPKHWPVAPTSSCTCRRTRPIRPAWCRTCRWSAGRRCGSRSCSSIRPTTRRPRR